MEAKAENSMIVSIDQKAIITPHEEPNNNITRSSLKKGKRQKNFFKVALFMMRGRSRKSKMLAVDDESKSIWRKLVGSMRPLHLQSNHDDDNNNNVNPHQSKMMKTTSAPSENGDDSFDSATEFGNSSSPASSRYASAVGLNEMVQEEEENEKINNNDGEGDEMIDAKAEEFIAQFYHQMRLQSLDVTDDHYQEISMRSLGL